MTSTNIQNPNGQYKKVLNFGIGILNLFGIWILGLGIQVDRHLQRLREKQLGRIP